MTGTRGRHSILVSSAGRRVELVQLLRQSLETLRVDGVVVAADAVRDAPALHFADERAELPPVEDDEFEAAVLTLCDRFGIGLIVPTIDPELSVYARLAPRLAAAGTAVHLSSAEVVDISGSKRRTNAWLRENGFPAPMQWDGQAGVTGTITNLPVIVKPDRGSSSIGVAVLRDPEGLRLACSQSEVVVEEIAQGVEYTVDVFVDARGRALVAVPRRRLATRGGEVSKGVTVRIPPVEQLVLEIAERLPGARGCFNVQVFHDDSTGQSKVVEINARFGGGYPLSHHAGAPMATWVLEEVFGLELTVERETWRDGVVMLRYDQSVFLEPAG